MSAPVIFTWNGETMIPLPRFLPLCNRQFMFGERYTLSQHEERSTASHGHYFARINEIWENLPDQYAQQFVNEVRLRKWALCRTKYRNERKIACASKREAVRIAAFMNSLQTDDDFYVEISVHGRVIVEITPKSQSYKAMSKRAFQDSKQQVLDVLDDLRQSIAEEQTKQFADRIRRAA